MKKLVGCLLMMVMCVAQVLCGGDDPRAILEKVKEKYESIADARLRFSQKVNFEVAKIEQNVTGTLLLKKGNKYRVELDGQTIVTNGETVWSYSGAQNQVLIDHFKMDERTFSPERILTATPTEYTPVFLGKERVAKTETVLLKLTPVSDDAYVKTLKLWVDASTWMIKKVEYADMSGKRTEYLVHDYKINIGLDDSQFTYQVPEGVDVVDLR